VTRAGPSVIRAAVCYELGRPLVVEEVHLDPPGAGEVRVRVGAVAICHSDVYLVRGEWVGWGADPPLVAGHEAAGLVTDVGADVTDLRPGDRVVVSLVRACGDCAPCRRAVPTLCEGTFALATEHRLRTAGGVPLNMGIRTAAFAEAVVVHRSQAVRIPDALPFDRAALLACGVMTGAGAVLNTAAVPGGASVVVIGAGGVGLNAVQGARLAGAHPIVAVDVLDAKLEAARTFGATHTASARDATLPSHVRELTGGHGADYVFVTVGSTGAVTEALRLVRRGGTVVLVGMPSAGATAPLPMGDVAWDGLRILGCNMGSSRPAVDVPRFARLYQEGRLMLDELITARYPLARINEAIESMERGEARRHVIVFDGGPGAAPGPAGRDEP
jgi:S-(hydroxymethyl)glutathione dehydrogenase/alcohol dehydrogenase